MRGTLVVFFGWTFVLAEPRVAHNDDKIVGGDPVQDIAQTPYMVFMQRPHGEGSQAVNCGGTIVTALWVATACHCVAAVDDTTGKVYSVERDHPLIKWLFVAGTVHLTKPSPHAQYRKPKSIHFHPECELTAQTYNDIALVKMRDAFRLNDKVKAVNIVSFGTDKFEYKLQEFLGGYSNSSNSSSPMANSTESSRRMTDSSESSRRMTESSDSSRPHCLTAGWGSSKLESLGNRLFGIPDVYNPDQAQYDPPVLKSSERLLVDEESCVRMFVDAVKDRVPGYIDSLATEIAFESKMRVYIKGQLCSRSDFKNETTCRGDSGGPLVCDGSLFGINIWNLACGEPTPDVHQNLAPMLGWFRSIVCNVGCRELEYRHPLCVLPEGFEERCGNTQGKPRTGRPERAGQYWGGASRVFSGHVKLRYLVVSFIAHNTAWKKFLI